MAKAARIQDGIVAEVVTLPEGVPLEDCFHPDAGFVPCDDTVSVGMTHQNGSFGPAPEVEVLSQPELA